MEFPTLIGSMKTQWCANMMIINVFLYYIYIDKEFQNHQYLLPDSDIMSLLRHPPLYMPPFRKYTMPPPVYERPETLKIPANRISKPVSVMLRPSKRNAQRPLCAPPTLSANSWLCWGMSFPHLPVILKASLVLSICINRLEAQNLNSTQETDVATKITHSFTSFPMVNAPYNLQIN